MTKIKTHKLFPIPIFEFKIQNHESLNSELEKYIYKLKRDDPKGMNLSNSGGWHSPYFNIRETEVLKNFVKIIYGYLHEIITKEYGWEFKSEKVFIEAMWSIINKKDSYNLRHVHPNCMLSAAYYVKAKKNCGKIQFWDPTEAKIMRHPFVSKFTELSIESIKFEPEEGTLFIFPAYLHHAVEKNLSEDDRIVISFNVDIVK